MKNNDVNLQQRNKLKIQMHWPTSRTKKQPSTPSRKPEQNSRLENSETKPFQKENAHLSLKNRKQHSEIVLLLFEDQISLRERISLEIRFEIELIFIAAQIFKVNNANSDSKKSKNDNSAQQTSKNFRSRYSLLGLSRINFAKPLQSTTHHFDIIFRILFCFFLTLLIATTAAAPSKNRNTCHAGRESTT